MVGAQEEEVKKRQKTVRIKVNIALKGNDHTDTCIARKAQTKSWFQIYFSRGEMQYSEVENKDSLLE